MGITVDWYDPEKTIIQYHFDGRWTWDDLYGSIKQVGEMFEGTTHRIDIIINVRESKGLPSGALTHLRNASMKASDNWGGGVFVGVTNFLEAILNTFFRIYPGMKERYAVAETVEEALAIIRARRAEALPDVSAGEES